MKRILFALLAIALLSLVACAPKETTPTAPTGPVTPAPAPAPEPAAPVEQPTAPGALANPFVSATCVGEVIKITIANVNDVAWTLGENMKIYLNAGIDTTPGCEKEVLEPGETMTCDQIDYPKVFPTRENVVQIVAAGERFTVSAISCTAAAAE